MMDRWRDGQSNILGLGATSVLNFHRDLEAVLGV